MLSRPSAIATVSVTVSSTLESDSRTCVIWAYVQVPALRVRTHGWMSDVLEEVQVHMPVHTWKPEVNIIIFLYHSPFYILSP